MITQEAHPDATIIWGAAFDNTLEDTIKVTVIATGFKADDDGKTTAQNTTVKSAPKTSAFNFSTSRVDSTVKKPEPQKTVSSEDSDSLISDSDFDDIMSILRKNRN